MRGRYYLVVTKECQRRSLPRVGKIPTMLQKAHSAKYMTYHVLNLFTVRAQDELDGFFVHHSHHFRIL